MGIGHVNIEFAERPDSSRCEAVTAHLVPTVQALLEHHNLRTEAGSTDCGGRAGRSAPDDCDVDPAHLSTVPRNAPNCTVLRAKAGAATVTRILTEPFDFPSRPLTIEAFHGIHHPPDHSGQQGAITMKNLTNKRIRTGLLTAALAGGTILGATQVGGIVNAQVDDVPTEQKADDLTREERREARQARREARQEVRQANAQEVADVIGVGVDVLHEWIRGGGTLAEVAEQNGVSIDAVVAVLVEHQNERIDEAVASGRIDADEANEKRAEVTERVTTRVIEGRPERGAGEGGFGPRGDRGDRGPRGHGGEGPPAGAPAAADAEG